MPEQSNSLVTVYQYFTFSEWKLMADHFLKLRADPEIPDEQYLELTALLSKFPSAVL